MKTRWMIPLLLLALGLTCAGAVCASGAAPDTAALHSLAGQIAPAAAATPHPILSDVRVRRAIAYCTDKDGLLIAAYPAMTAEQRQALISDTFVRPTSWAYTTPATVYAYAPDQGRTLLAQAGWQLAPGATYRTRNGKELVLTLRTTTALFRQTFLAAFEAQMRECGIRVIREHLDSTWVFGTQTGLQVRDFELAEFAWVMSDDDPGGQTIYACNQIPMPANGWAGQNYSGWCSTTASDAIATATNTALSQAERKTAYAVVINAAAADLPQLPLFWRYNYDTGQPSETWEHIDFNLETYSQDAELTPSSQATLTVTDYAGNVGSVNVPASAVTQAATLSYYPLVASAHAAPGSSAEISPFRLTAAVQGTPQVGFEFGQPVTLTVRYDDAGISAVREETLHLYRWDEDTGWQPAQDSCPEGTRYYQVDRAANTLAVHICHLSEFTLIGDLKHKMYLPLAPKGYPAPLRINFSAYPATLDPQRGSYVNEVSGMKLIYEGLTGLDENLKTVPGAAESWAYNADATELTFTLRADLQYSDGTPLNAKRFAYAILRNIDPMTQGEYASITDEIVGAPEYRGADVANLTPAQLQQLRNAVEVRALDAVGQPCLKYTQIDCRTLRLRFTRPAPYFHTVMSLWVTFPAKEELIAAGGAEWWQTPAHQVGNGPFVMAVNTVGTLIRFDPNWRYWKGRATYSIEYQYLTDGAAALAAYRAGQLDIIAVSAENRATIDGDPVLKQQLLTYPGSCTFALMFHNHKPPFTDPKVRQAFAYAIDREAWVRDVLGNAGSPTLTWIPPGYPGHDAAETRWGYNPDLARQALAASSYGGAANLPQITATFIDSERNRARWTWLIDQFRDVLGVEVAFNPVSSTEFNSQSHQMYILGWCADFPDPQNWLSTYWRTGGFGARIGYSNLAVDALLNQADAETNQATRLALYAQAQQMITADLPAAYMWNNVNAYLVQPRVLGIKTTPQDSDWAGSQVPLSITLP